MQITITIVKIHVLTLVDKKNNINNLNSKNNKTTTTIIIEAYNKVINYIKKTDLGAARWAEQYIGLKYASYKLEHWHCVISCALGLHFAASKLACSA